MKDLGFISYILIWGRETGRKMGDGTKLLLCLMSLQITDADRTALGLL